MRMRASLCSSRAWPCVLITRGDGVWSKRAHDGGHITGVCPTQRCCGRRMWGVQISQADQDGVMALDWSADGTYVATGDEVGAVCIYDIRALSDDSTSLDPTFRFPRIIADARAILSLCWNPTKPARSSSLRQDCGDSGGLCCRPLLLRRSTMPPFSPISLARSIAIGPERMHLALFACRADRWPSQAG